jgi:hypothetical protein
MYNIVNIAYNIKDADVILKDIIKSPSEIRKTNIDNVLLTKEDTSNE